uniref:Alkaline proteinase inhibitor n=1 Tax=Pseudomonas tolaasii TaxID=29442 RepID=INH_PSETO|nr:RecName: Full=Alkaline proteinase inhibitor; Flags: Precursor [Pseudomonas tolaasii]CAA07698.1 eprI protein [Pseudomonas tolaasii]
MPRFSHLIGCVWQVLFVSAGAQAMASSFVVPSTAQMAGQLGIEATGSGVCAGPAEQANALAGDVACAEQWLGDKPVSWSPTPDGIWLMNAEGTGITHLNRQKEGEYTGRTPSGADVTLQRTN